MEKSHKKSMFKNLKDMRTQREVMMFTSFRKLSMVLNRHVGLGVLSLTEA